jgi:glycosyltransferase involved in cell wall biosynthesis
MGAPLRVIPTVSVVIPLYNKRATIGRAIRSVLAQTETGFEIVVVDDGSTDGSAEVAREIADPRLRVVRQENAGPGAARNRGARETLSPLLAFLDADDEWRPDFLAEGVKMLGEHPEAGAYVCGYDAGKFRAERPNKLVVLGKGHGCSVLEPGLPGARLKAHVDAMHSSCTIIRRSLFDELGGYFSRDRCRYGEDSFLWLGVLLAGAVCWDPREHVRFHVEDSELGFAQTNRRAARPISLFPETLRERTSPEMRGTLDCVIGEFVAMDLRNLVRSGRLQAAHQLRSKHGMGGVRYSLYDSLRYAKYKLNHMLNRNYA